MTDTQKLLRDVDGKLHPDRFGDSLVCGSIAFASWASAANPTAEVLDQSASQLVTEIEKGVTHNLTNGTIEILRDGIYSLELNLSKVSAALASGVMDFSIQKNAAALSPTITCGLLQPAVANNHMAACAFGYATLAKGDLIRAVVTGTVGGVITVASGRLVVRQVSDTTNPTQV